MSNAALTWAWGIENISPAAKLVLIRLADRANEDAKCWPSISGLADECGLDRSTVIRAVKSLEEHKLISGVHVHGKKTDYRLHIGTRRKKQLVAPRHATSRTTPPELVAQCDTNPKEPKEDPHSLSSEPSPASEPELPQVIVATLKLTGKIPTRNITEREVKEWQPLYPGVNVLAECGKMAGWCIGNPSKRKTARGVDRFIHSWLANAQDQPRSNGNGRGQPIRETRTERELRQSAEILAANERARRLHPQGADEPESDIPF